jgi:glycosyltransferase involved in cell wall biosynthesis
MPVHLAIDAVGNVHGGGATILLDLLRYALADDRLAHISVFTSPRELRSFDLLASEKVVEIEQNLPGRSYLYRLFWFEHLQSRLCQRLGVDVLLCLNGIGHAHSPIPHVTYVQQSLPYSIEAMNRCSHRFRLQMKIVRLLTKRSCRSAARVIVQSSTMRDWLSRAFGMDGSRFRVFSPPIYLLPEAGDSEVLLQCMAKTPSDYRLLYVGSHWPYKNLEAIYSGMIRLRQESPEAVLFLIGPPVSSNHQEGVFPLGYLDRGDLNAAYRKSTLLVQPSLVESAPLPVAEAMSTGVPVLIADRPYAHDMCQDAAAYFDPLDPDDFAQKAVAVLQDKRRQAEMVARGKAIMDQRLRHDSYRGIADTLVEVAELRE